MGVLPCGIQYKPRMRILILQRKAWHPHLKVGPLAGNVDADARYVGRRVLQTHGRQVQAETQTNFRQSRSN